jgi:hypothetical protein
MMEWEVIKEREREEATMAKRAPASIVEHFSALKDPRIERHKQHKLLDIIVIAIYAVICGAGGWVGSGAFGKAKYKWLKGVLELPNGILSYDTFGRVFSLISPVQFQECFLRWIQAVTGVLGEQQDLASDLCNLLNLQLLPSAKPGSQKTRDQPTSCRCRAKVGLMGP